MDAATPARLSIGFLFPSWWEIEVAVATALLVVGVYSLLERISFGDAGGDDDRLLGGDEAPLAAREPARQSDVKEKWLGARFAISTCTARYGWYISVRQVTGTRTARYRTILPKIDRRRSIEGGINRRRSIEGEIDRRRSIEGEIDRRRSIEEEKGKKKEEKKKKEEEKKEYRAVARARRKIVAICRLYFVDEPYQSRIPRYFRICSQASHSGEITPCSIVACD
ncbi:hypothetical protein GW17_00020918 [Ensete ventricosum]|nr:hypothetical protein GW17_00020918 [Ensete ventricosum]